MLRSPVARHPSHTFSPACVLPKSLGIHMLSAFNAGSTCSTFCGLLTAVSHALHTLDCRAGKLLLKKATCVAASSASSSKKPAKAKKGGSATPTSSSEQASSSQQLADGHAKKVSQQKPADKQTAGKKQKGAGRPGQDTADADGPEQLKASPAQQAAQAAAAALAGPPQQQASSNGALLQQTEISVLR